MAHDNSVLGIIAGSGKLPSQVTKICKEKGRSCFVIAFNNETDITQLDDVPHATFDLGAVGKAITRLKQEEITEVLLVGRVGRPDFTQMAFDIRGIRLLSAIIRSGSYSDDAVFSAIVAFIEKQGFTVVGVADVVEELLMPKGDFGVTQDISKWQEDIRLGMQVATHLGSFDIGQAVVVKQSVVLGVEAVEGTDQLLERCAAYTGKEGGGVLVKVKKPQQDPRIDLPTIGIDTIRNSYKAGLKGVAVESGATIVIDQEAVFKEAESLGLFITGIVKE